MLEAMAPHGAVRMMGRVRCPFCGILKARGLTVCEGCGARWARRTNLTGWLLAGSVILLPAYVALRWLAPDIVAPKGWRVL